MSSLRRWLPRTKQIPFGLDTVILICVLAITILHFALHYTFTVDDAAISFSYARSFANGFGLGALFEGAARVEGYSNFLWVLLLGIGTWLGLETLTLSKFLALIFTLGCVFILYQIMHQYLRYKWLLIGLILLPISLVFIFWSVSGLENSLYSFLILSSIYYLIREGSSIKGVPYRSAITLVLVGMTRPEGVVYAMAGFAYKLSLVLAGMIKNRKSAFDLNTKMHVNEASHSTKPFLSEANGAEIRHLVLWLAIYIIGYGLFQAWRYQYFAYPLPNPIYAKANWNTVNLNNIWFQPQGWTYLRGYFRTFGAVQLIPVILFGAIISLFRGQYILIYFAMASLVLPVLTADWMINYRFIYPFIPFQVAFILLASDQLWGWLSGKERIAIPKALQSRPTWNTIASHSNGITRVAAIFVCIAAAFILARSTWANIRLSQLQLTCGYEQPWAESKCLGDRNYWTLNEVNQKYADLKSYADQIGVSDPRYLIPDIGATSYKQRLRIIDLAGLADVHLAHTNENPIRVQYIFTEQQPDFVQIHSIWTRRTDLTNFEIFWEQYLPILQNTDRQGHIHGTFIRKDLIITPVLSEAGGSVNSKQYKQSYSQDMVLVDMQAPKAVQPGVKIPLNLFWLATSTQATDWQQRVVLVDETGRDAFETITYLGYGWYPTTRWQPGEMLRQYIELPASLAKGIYTINISLVDPSRNLIEPSSYSTDFGPSEMGIQISDEAAKQYVSECVLSASLFRAQGDYQSAIRELEDALIAYPDDTTLISTLEDYHYHAQQHFLSKSKESLKAGRGDELVEQVRQAYLMRGRQMPSEEWVKFGEQIKQAAEFAEAQGDLEQAYLLYLSASMANPNDAWATRNLEITRRDYLIGTNMFGDSRHFWDGSQYPWTHQLFNTSSEQG